MKKIQPFIILLAFLFMLSSCKKGGEIVVYPSFGNLSISGTLSTYLLVHIDNKITDTLKKDLNIKLEEGAHKISFFDDKSKLILDTVMDFEKGKTRFLSNFLYTGKGMLFPDNDLTRKPAPGKMLVRFVLLDEELPDEMNLDLILYYTTPVNYFSMNIKINGVRKDKFSNYIELAAPLPLAPVGARTAQYVLEGYDLNGQKLMSIGATSAANTFGYIKYSAIGAGTTYIPNNIISLGIGAKISATNKIHNPIVIFERVAN